MVKIYINKSLYARIFINEYIPIIIQQINQFISMQLYIVPPIYPFLSSPQCYQCYHAVDLHVWRLSLQCASRRFFNAFTVLLLTASQDSAFQVVVVLMVEKYYATNALNRFTIIFSLIITGSMIEIAVRLIMFNLFRTLNTSISCPRNLVCTG